MTSAGKSAGQHRRCQSYFPFLLRESPTGVFFFLLSLFVVRDPDHIPELLMPWLPGEDKLEDGVLYVVDHEDQKEQYVEYNCPCG